MTTESFIHHLATCLKKVNPELIDYQLTSLEKESIRQLAEQKYSSGEWIYGYSPAYRFTRTALPGNKELNIDLEVEKGIIKKAGLSGSFYEPREARLLEVLLLNQVHLYESVVAAHHSLGITADDDLIYCYF